MKKLRNALCQPTDRCRHIGLHPEWLIQRIAVHRLHTFQQRLKGAADIGVKHTPGIGRNNVPPFLRKKRDAKGFLNQLHLMANSRMGKAQLIGGIADALMARRRFKAPQGF